jgi:hypothetical protein
MRRDFAISRRTFVAGVAGMGLWAGSSRRRASATEPPAKWQLLDSGVAPPARWDHTLAADRGTKQLILYGGRDASGASFDDTWLYDLVDHEWRQLDIEGPAPRFGQAVAVNQSSGKMILFGGQSSDTFFNDTWTFDFATETWTQTEIQGEAMPSPRYGLPAALDAENKFVISHGFTFEGRFDDTWSLDLESNRWSEISPVDEAARPLKRCLHEMIWNQKAGRLVLFGGCSSGFGPCPQGDLWAFDEAGNAWTELQQSNGPSPRSNPAMIYDERSDRMLLFGGLTTDGYAGDCWSGMLDGDDLTWSPLSIEGESPSPRASHDMVLARGDVYLFGGKSDTGVNAELWKLSLD